MSKPLTDDEIIKLKAEIIRRAHEFAHHYFNAHGVMVPLYLFARRLGRMSKPTGISLDLILKADKRFEMVFNPKTNGMCVFLNDFNLDNIPTHPYSTED